MVNLRDINEILSLLIEQIDDVDLNDLDAFGMDLITRKRLRVKRLHQKPSKKKIRRPTKTHMPFSMKNISHTLRQGD